MPRSQLSVDPERDLEIPRVSWRELAPTFIANWPQGAHFVVLGKTGRGKTTLCVDVCNRRWEQRQAKVCSFVTKDQDETSSKLLRRGWSRIHDWPPTYAERKKGRVILWPPYTKASTYVRDTRHVYRHALDEILAEKAWTLYLDEASYLVQSMGLRQSMDELFTQSRSNNITLVAGSQRPVWVSRSQLTQHSFVACFRIGDIDDARRAGEVIGNRDRYTPAVLNLGPHEFLLVDTINDWAYISEVGT